MKNFNAHILVVDDDDGIRDLVKQYLDQNNFSVSGSKYDLIQNEGLSLGTSCGINIAGAIRMGKELGPGKTIVTILCDRSDKYATKMFNKKFLEEKGLPIPNWF